MEFVTSADGTSIAYQRSGAGPPLLLVHGTTADHTRWARVLPAFEEHFTVCALDRRGRGGSGDAPVYEIEREAEDVAAVVEALGESVRVVGHSYGAVCSLEAALLTSRIERLVVYEPPIPLGLEMYPAGLPDRIQEQVDAGDREGALLTFFREVVGVPEAELDVMRSLPVWETRVALAGTIPRELRIDETYTFDPTRIGRINTPTLVLAGGSSAPLFHRAVAALVEALPRGRPAVMPGQGHVAMDTAPDLFLKEVLTFLTGPWRPDGRPRGH